MKRLLVVRVAQDYGLAVLALRGFDQVTFGVTRFGTDGVPLPMRGGRLR